MKLCRLFYDLRNHYYKILKRKYKKEDIVSLSDRLTQVSRVKKHLRHKKTLIV